MSSNLFEPMFLSLCSSWSYSIESFQRVFTGFKPAWDSDFRNRMNKLKDLGEYEEMVDLCERELKKYPNHVDATWFMATANFYLEKGDIAKEYFEKYIYLAPAWEKDADAYIAKINAH